MKLLISFLLFSSLFAPAVQGQPFPSYPGLNQFLPTSPGSLGSGLQGYLNPALLNYVDRMETVFAWSAARDQPHGANQWGWFTGFPHLGFGIVHRELPGPDLYDYRIALSAGDRHTGLGVGYSWSSGQTALPRRKNSLLAGVLLRPSPHLSLGLTLTTTLSAGARQGSLDLAIRPLGSERLTLFSDYAASSTKIGTDSYWSAGVALELIPGLRLSGRYVDDRTFSVGVELGLGQTGFQTQARFDKNRNHAFNTYAFRTGAFERGFRGTGRGKRYLDLDLFGPIRHRRFALFDDSRTLIELLALIQRAQDDPQIKGIAIRTSGVSVNPEMAWEVRTKLQEFKNAGKRVVAYIDRADLREYHFASVADHIVLDPAGMITLEGFILGQTYAKHALEKMGIGFEEWRFFKYKSAAESLSRHNMSAADREQLQELLEHFYHLAREEICQARGFAPSGFDRLVDDETVFLPRSALEKDLVDQVGRWDQVEELLENWERETPALIKAGSYPVARDRNWGRRPQIALIYALGICDMDLGIAARQLVKEIEDAAKNPRIKAVVLRVDSPGGDVLPSDLVAAAIKKCKKEKPVIVSQGYVAASGGYWLSMYGDAIVAAPNTITGSIGVIGGWLYNQGLKERLGLSTDHVQIGAHADLGFGMTLPLLDLSLPDRNLTDREKDKMEHAIRILYGDFVEKVAEGRGKSPEEIEALAQGRVWSGQAAVEKGLADRLGGLDMAIQLAKEKAGIANGDKVHIVELPRSPLFDPSIFLPRLLGIRAPVQHLSDYLQFRLEHNGEPLLILPLENFGEYHFSP